MSPIQIVVHNFWAQAEKLHILDDPSNLTSLLELLVDGNEEDFADALEAKGYTVTKDD